MNNTLCNEICKYLFNETLDNLIEKQFIKCNIISNRECLSLPKDSELHHRSIQSTQEDSSVHEHLNSCALLDSETNRKSFPFKEELEAFKAQVISEIKNLIHKEISVLKEAITTHSNIDVLSGKAQTEEFYQEQLRFMNEELRNQKNLIISLLNQLSKQTGWITSYFLIMRLMIIITIMTTLIVKITLTLMTIIIQIIIIIIIIIEILIIMITIIIIIIIMEIIIIVVEKSVPL